MAPIISKMMEYYSMKFPEMTHLQFFVLGTLLEGELSGREVRDRMAGNGVRKTGPAFYQMMARLEDAGLVEGRYDPKVVDGQPIKERRYNITGHGIKSWEDVRDFYLAQATGKTLGWGA